MRILGKDKLSSFMKMHPRSRGPLAAWLKEAEAAQWRQWADIKGRHPAADLIGSKSIGHRVIFNIKGNDYRLAALIYFNQGMIIVERIGTHAQYDKWNMESSS